MTVPLPVIRGSRFLMLFVPVPGPSDSGSANRTALDVGFVYRAAHVI